VNRGFGHANNCGTTTCDARYFLFLNPDTEIRYGDLGQFGALLDEPPHVGVAGVRQMTPDGALCPTIRRFSNALRALGETLALERLGRCPHWAGERELDRAAYDRETACDWTAGSFMLVRRDALVSAGLFDESPAAHAPIRGDDRNPGTCAYAFGIRECCGEVIARIATRTARGDAERRGRPPRVFESCPPLAPPFPRSLRLRPFYS
jgi:hypothetical protein